jgi:hypothetical protein
VTIMSVRNAWRAPWSLPRGGEVPGSLLRVAPRPCSSSAHAPVLTGRPVAGRVVHDPGTALIPAPGADQVVALQVTPARLPLAVIVDARAADSWAGRAADIATRPVDESKRSVCGSRDVIGTPRAPITAKAGRSRDVL